jgi:hypothetical protein
MLFPEKYPSETRRKGLQYVIKGPDSPAVLIMKGALHLIGLLSLALNAFFDMSVQKYKGKRTSYKQPKIAFVGREIDQVEVNFLLSLIIPG